MGRKCNHKTTRYDWGRDATGAEVAVARWCIDCGERMSMGLANDRIKGAPLRSRKDRRDDAKGFDWDPSRPIAEQLAGTARDDAAADRLLADLRNPNAVAEQVAEQLCEAIAELPEGLDLDAMEYEVTRSAEPDFRDEDDARTAGCPEHPAAVENAAGFCAECVAMIDDSLLAAGKILDAATESPDPVCSCQGDALASEHCGGES